MFVTDPHDVDDALDLAIDRTIHAQDEFESTPPADPALVPKATVVVHRADDVKELAHEAEVTQEPPSDAARNAAHPR
jgi:hypothetical protein